MVFGKSHITAFSAFGCNRIPPALRDKKFVMDPTFLFNPRITSHGVPHSDAARQAVASLRGYVYQTLAAALAWVDINEKSRLYLEVAEDYATVANQVLEAVQVKDTVGSGSVTLNSQSVKKALESFVHLVAQNPNSQVTFRFFTTSEIGTEQNNDDRPEQMAGLKYWRKVVDGADPSPLRTMLESERFPKTVRVFCKARDDEELRRDLFARIHWDCGQPKSSTIRQELEQRLVVVGRKNFLLPAQKVRGLADDVVYRVLQKSIIEDAEQRVLTLADLYQLIDEATRASVPYHVLDRLGFPGALAGGLDANTSVATADTRWLTDGASLAARRGTIARPAVESAVADALRNSGVCVLIGSSGIGKTVVAQKVAELGAENFCIADFRDTPGDEARYRLDNAFALIGGLPSSILILEDLNQLDDPQVVLSLGRVIEACRRRDRKVIITCYLEPTLGMLAEIGLGQDCVVVCPYFSQEETRALVRSHGGNPDVWGRLTYAAGAGHPQLTHAFVVGVSTRGWPVNAIDTVIGSGLSSDDIDTTRQSARRRLVSKLPKDTRTLLYRLSLTTGRFSRSMALAIGEVPPRVSQAGECMDRLTGPWIEPIGGDLHRVSPLASNFGKEMLSAGEQRRVHETIAVRMMSHGTVDASDINSIVRHAREGELPEILARLAKILMSVDAHTLETLAEYPLIFRFFRTDQPIYPKDLFASGALRLTQFKLAAAAGDGSSLAGITAALVREISCMPEGEPRRTLEAMSLCVVLSTKGIANYLDDWISLLLRLKALRNANIFLRNFIAAVDSPSSNVWSILFNIGVSDLDSVGRLEHIVNRLDELDPSDRALMLTPLASTLSDYAVLVNSPWATRGNNENFDAGSAAMAYQRMAVKARNWGIRALSLQCSIAQAIMLDEYQNDKIGALAVHQEARTALGEDVILGRARAKVHLRHEEYEAAFEIFRGIARQVGGDDPVERAFALRDAAISAAKCDDWAQAEKWFVDAQQFASRAPGEAMEVMAIGLGADSAVSALKAGDAGGALSRLAGALEALSDVDPETTVRAAYCHRVLRHAVLWMKSRIQKSGIQVGRLPIALEPGTCSNPDPLPAIREHPLGDIDIAWYMLAEAETATGLDVGIRGTLYDRLALGPIPSMEIGLRMQAIQMDIHELDTVGFATHFTAYVETATFMVKMVRASQGEALIDPLTPERGQVPALRKHPPFDPVAENRAKDAILAYGIRSALARHPEAIVELKALLDRQFQGLFPGSVVFDHLNASSTTLMEWDQQAANAARMVLQREHMEPSDLCLAGAHLFEWIDHSDFKNPLTAHLALWLRPVWKRVTTEQAFRLSTPTRTVPLILEILAIPENDRRFVAKLLIATAEAVGARLPTTYRNRLKVIAG